jgi:polysaccharide export outer membrane protein
MQDRRTVRRLPMFALRRCEPGTTPATTAIGWSVVAALLLASGCNRGAYRASKLPSQYQATVVHSAQHVDLSRLSQTSPKSEVVYPGDTVTLSVATGLESRPVTGWLLRVNEAGAVNVPLIGDVDVGGMELTLAESAVQQAGIERGIYRNPQVTMTIQRRRSNKVTVLGAVHKEGTYELPSNQSDLLAALVAAGGLSEEADTRVEIRNPGLPYLADSDSGSGNRAGSSASVASDREPGADRDVQLTGYSNQASMTTPQAVQVDLASPDAAQSNLRVQDGGVIMVMQRPPSTVQVLGLVKKPGQVEIPPEQEMHLLDAVAMAGGLTTEIADKVLIVRQVPGQNQSVLIQGSMDRAKRNHLENIPLAAGDVVSVEQTPLTFITGELYKYMRFSVTAASRLALF